MDLMPFIKQIENLGVGALIVAGFLYLFRLMFQHLDKKNAQIADLQEKLESRILRTFEQSDANWKEIVGKVISVVENNSKAFEYWSHKLEANDKSLSELKHSVQKCLENCQGRR